jgi:hypothetical protein
MKFLHCTAVALTLFGAAVAAQASTVTYDLNVTALSGSLAGGYTGFFSYDSTTTVPGGQATGPGLLTDFSFDFGGVHYDTSNAFTGMLSFDGAGALIDLDIGTDCSSSPCSPTPGQAGFAMTNNNFAYSTADSSDVGSFLLGRFDFSLRPPGGGTLPEPTSLALVLSAVLLACGSRRRA